MIRYYPRGMKSHPPAPLVKLAATRRDLCRATRRLFTDAYSPAAAQ